MNGSTRTENQDAQDIAIVGCGLIGQAWAVVFARAGFRVRLYDHDPDAARLAPSLIAARLSELEDAGLLKPGQAKSANERLAVARSLEEAVKNACYVQENTLENLEVKSQITADIDAALAPEVPIGSSTSGIPASQYAHQVEGRSRCIVVHPINPPHLVPAVEVIPAPFTDPVVTEKVQDLMHQIGQSTILLNKEVNGFVVNRLQGALLREAFDLLAQGVASSESIDRAISDGLGLRWALMGPFQTIHLNAPEGVTQYVARYGPMYEEMFADSGAYSTWQSCVASGLAEDLSKRFPLNQLQDAQNDRDARLMGLLRALRGAVD